MASTGSQLLNAPTCRRDDANHFLHSSRTHNSQSWRLTTCQIAWNDHQSSKKAWSATCSQIDCWWSASHNERTIPVLLRPTLQIPSVNPFPELGIQLKTMTVQCKTVHLNWPAFDGSKLTFAVASCAVMGTMGTIVYIKLEGCYGIGCYYGSKVYINNSIACYCSRGYFNNSSCLLKFSMDTYHKEEQNTWWCKPLLTQCASLVHIMVNEPKDGLIELVLTYNYVELPFHVCIVCHVELLHPCTSMAEGWRDSRVI